jgi:hypothetical protein
VGSRRDCTWVLGLPGFRVETIEVRTTPGPVDFGCVWNATGGNTRAVDVADGSVTCGRSRSAPGTICRGQRIP